MKIFISIPMGGRGEEAIKKAFEEESKLVLAKYPDAEIVETVFPCDEECSMSPLYFLGRAIQKLHEADAIWFAYGWEKCRGCRCERKCAEEYGIKILN